MAPLNGRLPTGQQHKSGHHEKGDHNKISPSACKEKQYKQWEKTKQRNVTKQESKLYKQLNKQQTKKEKKNKNKAVWHKDQEKANHFC